MSFKIFRLHNAQAVNTDWHQTGKLNDADISTIQDPADANYRIPVTSIPSPFGRLHLVESAFRFVNEQALNATHKLDGQSIYHRLVSESLDLTQLLFESAALNNAGMNIDVLDWELNTKLSKLKSSSAAHRLLAETLELYIKQSPTGSPLNSLQHFYIVRIGHRVVGASSPSTMFFSTPNDANFQLPTPIKIKNDTLFDAGFCPLYKRDPDFQEFLYLFFESMPQLKLQMPLMFSYLQVNLNALAGTDHALWNKLQSLSGQGQAACLAKLNADYGMFNVAGPGTPLQLLPGVFWYQSKAGSSIKDSDFMVGSFSGGKNQKFQGEKLPLVLQNGYGFPLQYWGSNWDKNISVPYQDLRALTSRTLPNMMAQYPYLTVADFFQPQLMRLPYHLNNKHYFDGNAKGFEVGNKHQNIPPDASYLLPLKRTFFEYFDSKDLERSLADGNKVFELVKVNEQSVKAILRLPLAANGHYVTLERVYTMGKDPKISEKDNEGSIVDSRFNLGIMPFFRDVTNQRVCIIERDEQNQMSNYKVDFYANDTANPLSIAQKAERSSLAAGDSASSHFYQVDNFFDYLVLSKNEYQGVIIPRFPHWQSGMGSFTFAVDFGTTNTHIEYATSGAQPQPFDITEKDSQLLTLQDPDWEVTPREIQNYFLYEVAPKLVGEHGPNALSDYSFPTRTALAEGNKINFQGALLTYGDFNPALYFEQKRKLSQTIVSTELKWNNVAGNVTAQKRVTAYLESLMILMRNKVLLNGGNLSNTKLVWFYPASMGIFALGSLRNDWKSLFAKYFPGAPASNLVEYSESEAPYYHVASKIPTMQPVVNIDIGGGSSDVVIFLNNKPELYTSVKFAGNALYGNGYQQGRSLDNGVVKHFSRHVDAFLQSNYYNLLDLNELYAQFSSPATGNSPDLISFFFSLENNKSIRDKNMEFSFSKLLQQDTEFKPIYYLFFSSLFYYLARTMKIAGMEMPSHILFSGNGSKNLNLLDLSGNGLLASQLARAIFEHVYQKAYHQNGLQVICGDKPKEATCKGGIQRLNMPNSMPSQQPENLIWLGNTQNFFSNELGNRFPQQRIKYEEIMDLYDDVLAEVRAFFQLIFVDIREKVRLNDFGLNLQKLNDFHQYLSIGLDGYLNAGVQARLSSGTTPADALEETLFLYPIVGALHRLGQGIANGQV